MARTLKIAVDSRETVRGFAEGKAAAEGFTRSTTTADAAVRKLEGAQRRDTATLHAMANAQRLTSRDIEEATRAYDRQFGSTQDLSRAHQEAIRWNQFFDAQTRQKTRSMSAAHAEALRMNAEFDRMNAGTRRTTGGIGRLNNALIVMTRRAVGANAVTGQLTDVIGTFALGLGKMTAILAGLAAIALAWQRITREAREAKKEQEEAGEILERIQKRQAGPRVEIERAIAVKQEELKDLEERMANARRLASQAATGQDVVDVARERGLESLRKLNAEHRKIVGQIAAGERELARLTEEEAEKRARAIEEEQRRIAQAVAAGQQEINRAQEAMGRARDASREDRERIQAMELELDERERMVAAMREGQDAVDALTVALAGERAVREASETEVPAQTEKRRRLAEALARLEIEERKLTDAQRESERATKEAERADRERLQQMRESIRAAEDYARATIQLAEAFGALDAGQARGLSSLVQVGQGIGLLLAGGGGVGAGVASIAGGIASLFGGDDRQAEEMRRLREATARLADVMEGAPAELAREALDVFGGFDPRKEFAPGVPRTTPIPPGFFSQEEIERLKAYDAAMVRITETFRRDLEVRRLVAAGKDEEAQAIRDLIELEQARRAGWDEDTIALLELTQQEERLAEARRRAHEEAQRAGGLIVRALELMGQSGASQRAGLALRQQDELFRFQGTPEMRELMEAVHFMERMDLETALRIEAIQKEAEKQTQALDEQIRIDSETLRATEDQLRAQERMVADLERTVEALDRAGRDLLLGPLSPLSPAQRLAEAQSEFETLRALALSGDVTAAQSLPDAARAFLEASREMFASSPRFVEDFRLVQETLGAVREQFAGQLTIEEQMLAELQARRDQLQEQIELAQQQRDAIQQAAEEQIAEVQAQHQEAMARWGEIVEQLIQVVLEQQGLRDDLVTDTGTPGLPDFDFTFSDEVTGAFNEQVAIGRQQLDKMDRQIERMDEQLTQLRAGVVVDQEGHGQALTQRDENTDEIVQRLDRIARALSGDTR